MTTDLRHLYIKLLKFGSKVINVYEKNNSYHITVDHVWPLVNMTYILDPVEREKHNE